MQGRPSSRPPCSRTSLKVIRDVAADGREKYQSRLILVRPDQFVAWTGDETPPAGVLLRAAGAAV